MMVGRRGTHSASHVGAEGGFSELRVAGPGLGNDISQLKIEGLSL